MATREFPNLEMLTRALSRAERPTDSLDQMAWALIERHEYPLTHYDLETWEGSVSEDQPSARLVSDPGAAFRFLAETWPRHHLEMEMSEGAARIRIRILGMGTLVEGAFKGKLEPASAGLGLACALAEAHQRRVLRVHVVAEHVEFAALVVRRQFQRRDHVYCADSRLLRLAHTCHRVVVGECNDVQAADTRRLHDRRRRQAAVRRSAVYMKVYPQISAR